MNKNKIKIKIVKIIPIVLLILVYYHSYLNAFDDSKIEVKDGYYIENKVNVEYLHD